LANNIVQLRASDRVPDHTRMVEQFEEAEQASEKNRKLQERDVDYRDNKQLTETQREELKRRGQPPVVLNEIRPKINTMLGLEKQTRKDPKAFPRNPGDDKAAEAATDGIRYVCEDSNWDDKRSKAADDIASAGFGVIKVHFKEHRGALDPAISRVAWDRFYYDPASGEQDFADASFMGEVVWMDFADAKLKFPDAGDALAATWDLGRSTETYDDKPKDGLWVDRKRQRVRLCEHYYREGGAWKFCIFTKGGFVVDPTDSPYTDDEGIPECPLKAVHLYVDRDNNRFGEIRAMIDPQDEINKRRSKALHLTNTRQIRVSPTVATDPDVVRKELSRPDGIFIGENGDVEVLRNDDMLMGNLSLMQDAREHMHRTGPNSAMAGKDVTNQSGRAILAQQQGGMNESSTFLDAVRILSIAVYRSVWARIKQAWDAERWVRVTDNESNMRWVGFNRPVTMLEEAAKRLGIDPENPQQADPQAMMMYQAFSQDPRSQQVVGVENNPSDLDVDIILDEGLDTPTIAAEQFTEFANILPSLVNLPPPYAKLLVQASSLKNKDVLLETIDQMMQPNPAADAARELEMASAQAEVENTQADTAKKTADAQATQWGVVAEAARVGAGR